MSISERGRELKVKSCHMFLIQMIDTAQNDAQKKLKADVVLTVYILLP